MRRTFAAFAVALTMTVSALALGPGQATAGEPADPSGLTARAAESALDRATAVLSGSPGGGAGGEAGEAGEVSATLALRDLFVALPSLTGADRARAQGLLARPTQGADDPNGDGYTVDARTDCSRRICMHWVPTTADAPPGRSWVDTTMTVMKKVWAHEVGKLGYRRPVRDGSRGGNEKFDVYLKDVGSDGYYGYCAPERTKPGHKWVASGYCVLDNDFARSQFGTKPMASLRVTAAHEFFHAVQFAYDYGEDRWLLEASATWMEERVADDVNDNRQYLRHGQVAEPADPLDLFNPSAFDQYGNWAFFEYLSRRFGIDIVRRIWNRSGAFTGAPDLYSTQAVRDALPRRTSWVEVFRAYAAGNTIPGRTYAEGGSWPSAATAAGHTLSPDGPRAAGSVNIDHMASKTVVARPADTLRSRTWTLRVRVDGPRRRTMPAAYVVVHKKSGKIARKPLRLDRDGDGTRTFRFTRRSVTRATVTLVNASTRFNCWEQQTTYSCQGVPKHDDRRFGYTLRVFRR